MTKQWPLMPNQRQYFCLLSLHQILMLTSLCFVHRFVEIGGVSFPLSALIFPLTFLTTDLAAAFSHQQAKNMMWLGILAQLPFALLCMLACLLPTPSQYVDHAAYQFVFAGVLRTACASIIGCAVGQALNIYIFTKLQKRVQQLRFAWRYLIAGTIGQTAFTITALPLIFWGDIARQQLLLLVVGSIIAKFAYSTVLALISNCLMNWYQYRGNCIDITKYQQFTNLPLALQQPTSSTTTSGSRSC